MLHRDTSLLCQNNSCFRRDHTLESRSAEAGWGCNSGTDLEEPCELSFFDQVVDLVSLGWAALVWQVQLF